MMQMNIRTDLALERREIAGDCPGVESEEQTAGGVRVTRIRVTDEAGEQAVGKPKGNYITLEMEPFSDGTAADEQRRETLTAEISRLLPRAGTVLVVGLGNHDITPDALGPKTAGKIFATRHIPEQLAREVGFGTLRPVCAVAPGVLGQTGMETAEIIFGIAQRIQPAAVIAVDALASRRLSRLGCTVQLSDTGVSPGSGVGNRRSEINQATVGVPVIALGVPTVVDASTLVHDLTGGKDQAENQPLADSMVVTPREIDTVIEHASDLLSLSINCALHPDISPADLAALV